MMPLWNLRSREGKAFNWDGSNTTLREVVQSSAIGSGTTTTWLDRDSERWDSTDPQSSSSLRRIVNYIENVQAPKYPFAIDPQMAAAGAQLYRSQCAQCHESGTGRTGSVIPLAEIGTDRHRLETWTADAATAYKAYSDRHAWKSSSVRKTDGYVAAPLAGIWLNAPYLHNGSVPTLADLLEAPSIRPVNFWRGYDVYDPIRVGFVTNGTEAERAGTRYDVALAGNSNAGHAYGTTLTPDEKRRLIEYLKTL